MKTIMPRGLRHFELDGMRIGIYFLFCALLSFGIYSIAPFIEAYQQESILNNIADALKPVSNTTYISSIVGVLVLLGMSFLPSVLPNKPLSYFLRIIVFFLGLPTILYFLDSSLLTVTPKSHLVDVTESTRTFLQITPIFLFVTTFFLPGNLIGRFVWIAVAVCFMITGCLALPYLHMYLLQYTAPYFIPVLNIFMSKLLLSFELVCFYGLVASQK